MVEDRENYLEYAVSALRDSLNRTSMTLDRVEGYDEQDRDKVLAQVQLGGAKLREAEDAVHEALSKIGGYEDKSPYRRKGLGPRYGEVETFPSYLVPVAAVEAITEHGERDDSFVFDFEVREGDKVETFEVRITGTEAISAGLGDNEDLMGDWVAGHFDQLLSHLAKDRPALDQLRALEQPIYLRK